MNYYLKIEKKLQMQSHLPRIFAVLFPTTDWVFFVLELHHQNIIVFQKHHYRQKVHFLTESKRMNIDI